MPNQMTDNGLLSAGPPQQQAQPPGMGQQPQGQTGRPPVQMDEQEQADMFMAYGVKTLHDQKVSDNIVNTLLKFKSVNEIIDYIARSTVDIVSRVESAAGQKQVKIGANVKLQTANFLMGEIINLAEIAGVKKLDKEQKAQAFSLAVSIYIDEAIKTGKMKPEELQQAAEQLKQTPEGQKVEQSRIELSQKMKGKKDMAGKQPVQPPPQQAGLLGQGGA